MTNEAPARKRSSVWDFIGNLILVGLAGGAGGLILDSATRIDRLEKRIHAIEAQGEHRASLGSEDAGSIPAGGAKQNLSLPPIEEPPR